MTLGARDQDLIYPNNKKQKKYTKWETRGPSRIYIMHQKEISNKAKTSKNAKIKISSLNNRVRCNKNIKLTKKIQKPKMCSAPKNGKPAARVGKNRKTLKN